eukprot:m.94327 g.94327  ORF g.94327 m.94327 type:complete len:471 (-) comp12411_c0_seq2:2212-3624(-)
MEEAGRGCWPTSKLVCNAESRKEELDCETKEAVVLLTTGAMNPVHIGHVAMMAHTKSELERVHNKIVLAGFISPSHELYVGPKCHSNRVACLPTRHRLHAAFLACEDSDWLECGSWEALSNMGGWPDFCEVAENLREYLQGIDELPKNIRVVYVCGYDHFARCGLHRGLHVHGTGVACVSRHVGGDVKCGTTDSKMHVFSIANDDSEHINEDAVAEDEDGDENSNDEDATLINKHDGDGSEVKKISSSLIRKRLLRGQSVVGLLHRSVFEYLTVGKGKGVLCPAHRYVYLSLTQLIRRFPTMSDKEKEELEHGLFLFGSKRMWVFPKTPKEKMESHMSGPYLREMPSGLLKMIRQKEKKNEVFFLKKDEFGTAVDYGGTSRCDYNAASTWLASLIDPVTKSHYAPLQLDVDYWRGDAALQVFKQAKKASFKRFQHCTGDCVATLIEEGTHDYTPCMCLFFPSHPTLHATI